MEYCAWLGRGWFCAYVEDILKEKINSLKRDKLGLESASIHEVEMDTFKLSSEDRFQACGISYDEIISSKVHSESTYSEYGMSDDVAGKTTFYVLNGEVRSAIFVIVIDPMAPEDIIKQYVVLLHELGHVSDMENHVNFGGINDEVDAVKAEGYAEVFALKHLDRDKKDLVDVLAKGLYAGALLKRKESNDFYMRVHQEITKYFREKRLKDWSKKI